MKKNIIILVIIGACSILLSSCAHNSSNNGAVVIGIGNRVKNINNYCCGTKKVCEGKPTCKKVIVATKKATPCPSKKVSSSGKEVIPATSSTTKPKCDKKMVKQEVVVDIYDTYYSPPPAPCPVELDRLCVQVNRHEVRTPVVQHQVVPMQREYHTSTGLCTPPRRTVVRRVRVISAPCCR